MNLNKVFQYFAPKDSKFLPLFVQNSNYLVQASELLIEVVKEQNNKEKQVEHIRAIKKLETQADDCTHAIFDTLNSTFITPFDREDIHKLTSTMDDVIDLIDGAAQRIELFSPKHLPPAYKKMAEIIYLAGLEIRRAVAELNNINNPINIKDACLKINTLENEADVLFHQTIKELFDNEKDAIELIKLRDIIITLETATDIQEDVADVIKSILIKNA